MAAASAGASMRVLWILALLRALELAGSATSAPTRASTTTAPTRNPSVYYLEVALDHSLCFDQCALADQVGGMDATLMNGATCTAGEGVVLDGEDDYLDLVGQSFGGGPMTVAIWARWDALNENERLCEFADGRDDDNIVIKYSGASGTISFSID